MSDVNRTHTAGLRHPPASALAPSNKQVDDIAHGVKALKVAVDRLHLIAEFGGVQGAWAIDALLEVKAIMCPERPVLRAVDSLDAALGEGRR